MILLYKAPRAVKFMEAECGTGLPGTAGKKEWGVTVQWV